MKNSEKIRRNFTIAAAGIVVGVLAAGLGAFGMFKINAANKKTEELASKIESLESELQNKETRIAQLEEVKASGDVDVYLPEIFYVAAGRTMELYNNQVAFGTDSSYSFNWVCDIGKNLEKKYQVSPGEEHIGDHTLSLSIYDKDLNQIYTGETLLRVVAASVGEPVKILNIGDSFSDSTPWYQEVRTLSQEAVRFVGTRGEENLQHEGRSGFSICDYTTETDYPYGQEGVHPFYNPSTGGFDYAYYKEKTGVEPDVIQIFLGKNGMSLDPEPGIEWLKEIVNNIHEADPQIPIFIVQTTYMGDQNGIGNETDNKGNSALNGWYKKEEDKKVFLWTRALEEHFGGDFSVNLIPVALTFDSEHSYRTSDIPVNARSSRTEPMLTEGMHPSTEGYLQIADTLFSYYCGLLNEQQ